MIDVARLAAGHGVVHYGNLALRNFVHAHDEILGEVADAHDPVGRGHPLPLDVGDHGIHVLAAAVGFGGVHMHHERFAADALGHDAGGIGHPVVAVDNIEVLPPGEHLGREAVAVDLTQQILPVAAVQGQGYVRSSGPRDGLLLCRGLLPALKLFARLRVRLRSDVGREAGIEVLELQVLFEEGPRVREDFLFGSTPAARNHDARG